MQYQLTLQFRGDTLADYDAMVALEEQLANALGDSAEVDGHDCGSGETNIFILTGDAMGRFRRLTPVLEHSGVLGSLTAAYRDALGEDYTVIWPARSQKGFTVA